MSGLRPWLLFLTLFYSISVIAQQAQVIIEQGLHYTGIPVDVRVVADGFDEVPQPVVEVSDPAQRRLNYVGVSPNINTSIQIINGQMTQTKIVRFVFHYTFTADKPGNYSIGPFTISQDGRSATTPSVPLAIGDIPAANNQTVRVVFPEQPIYVSQRTPVRLEWRVDADLRGKLFNQRVQWPLLTRYSDFELVAVEDTATSTLLVDTPAGPKEVPATLELITEGAKQYMLYSVEFILTALVSGDYTLQPTMVTVDEAVRWRRDLFGNRRPTHARKRRVTSEQQILQVINLPTADRPESFAGAVGQGFSLQVSADRSVVQVGDPIALTINLQGDASVKDLALPSLAALGLSATAFRLPDNTTIAGRYENGSKTFQVTVRVNDETVNEIPPLNFSWFDPQRKAYQTTQSQPIALSVRSAQVVSAQDVVISTAQQQALDQQAQREEEQQKAAENKQQGQKELAIISPQRPAFTLSGADLTIEKDITRLSDSSTRLFGITQLPLQTICYSAGLLVLGLAFIGRRRGDVDPAVIARRQTLKQQRHAVMQASTVRELVGALRQIGAEITISSGNRSQYEALLAECDNRIYAPTESAKNVDDVLRQRALTLADEILAGAA